MSGRKLRDDQDPLDDYADVGDSLGPPTQGPVPRVDQYLGQPLAPPMDPLDSLPDMDPSTSNPVPQPVQKTPAPDESWIERYIGGAGPNTDSMGIQQLPGKPDQELMDTVGDTGVGFANGMTLNNGDELAGLLGGQGAQQGVQQRVDLAHQRSPVGSRVGEGAGGMALNAMLPGSGAAATMAKAAGMGFASGVGGANGANVEDSMKSGARSAAMNMATAAAPMVAGPAMQAMGTGMKAAAPILKRSAQYGMAFSPVNAAKAAAAGMAAPYAGAAMQGAGQGVGNAASSIAGAMAPMEGQSKQSQQKPQIDRGNDQGNTMGGQVRQILAKNPQMLGQYAQQFDEADKNGTLGALIDNLEQSDARFRMEVSPMIRNFH